jgi:hypothetical protein
LEDLVARVAGPGHDAGDEHLGIAPAEVDDDRDNDLTLGEMRRDRASLPRALVL